MKILTPFLHGLLDYVTVVIFLVAPTALGLAGLAAVVSYALAGVHLLMTIVTNFRLGVIKLVPFTLHGWVERIVGPVLVILPFILGFENIARLFYIAMGVIIVIVGVLTNYANETANQ
ncbi:MAG: hypothetical protein K8S54_06865 [Spirochaetia bacterium]|nr:hypothetical protein [Spirochaetia bacterium]